MLTRLPATRRTAKGFTLVEMMVAMALGLIVVAAVLAFIFSLIRANSETVLDTRLNQELRATMAVIAGEVKRARAIPDPISAVGKDGAVDYNNDGVIDNADLDFPKIYGSTALAPNEPEKAFSDSCVRYAYYDGNAIVYRAIYLDSGRVHMATASTRAGATCSSGSPINAANSVQITTLQFDYDPVATGKRRFSIRVDGELASPPAYMTQNPAMAIRSKTIRQIVSIRSNDA
jgi:prepilin-type N-terminal cleavage/methylation domain-containing protein